MSRTARPRPTSGAEASPWRAAHGPRPWTRLFPTEVREQLFPTEVRELTRARRRPAHPARRAGSGLAHSWPSISRQATLPDQGPGPARPCHAHTQGLTPCRPDTLQPLRDADVNAMARSADALRVAFSQPSLWAPPHPVSSQESRGRKSRSHAAQACRDRLRPGRCRRRHVRPVADACRVQQGQWKTRDAHPSGRGHVLQPVPVQSFGDVSGPPPLIATPWSRAATCAFFKDWPQKGGVGVEYCAPAHEDVEQRNAC